MFSRAIFINKSTEKLSTHQRLMRASRRQITRYLPKGAHFPNARLLVHFEGANGPDGLSGKHTIGDEPYQFIKPQSNGGKLVRDLKHYLYGMNRAYKKGDEVKLAFSASWAQHLITDGLTPAHQQPFKEQLRELDDRDISELNGIFKRIFMPGDTPWDFLLNNWKRLGPKGIGTNHMLFEAGIDFIVMPMHPKQLMVKMSRGDVQKAKNGRFIEVYLQSVNKIAELRMFESYVENGWTTELAKDVREVLLPEVVKCITLGWIAGIYCGK